MNFVVGLIIFNMLVLGINFCFLLIGGPWQKGENFQNVKVAKKVYTIERFTVGVSISILGLSYLVVWLYFMFAAAESFSFLLNRHFVHILLQLIASLTMIIAGVGIFRQWRRNKAIFLTSVTILMLSTIFALSFYGPSGHAVPSELMVAFSLWVFIFGGILTTATYFLGRLIHNYDERLETEDKVFI
jgi:hypothetical protein